MRVNEWVRANKIMTTIASIVMAIGILLGAANITVPLNAWMSDVDEVSVRMTNSIARVEGKLIKYVADRGKSDAEFQLDTYRRAVKDIQSKIYMNTREQRQIIKSLEDVPDWILNERADYEGEIARYRGLIKRLEEYMAIYNRPLVENN